MYFLKKGNKFEFPKFMKDSEKPMPINLLFKKLFRIIIWKE